MFEQQVAEMEAMHREELQRREELSSHLTLAHREKAHILEQVCVLGSGPATRCSIMYFILTCSRVMICINLSIMQ